MTRITVRTDGGKVRIRLRDEARAPVGLVTTEAETLELPKGMADTKRMLQLSARLTNLMEIRAESASRPNEEDVEIVYALSGREPNVPDILHKLSSRTVVEEAATDYITASTRATMEHIAMERGNQAKLIINVHTHPQSIPKPSEGDKQYFENAAETIKTLVPDANVLFGVHAISSELIRERRKPVKVSRNTIKWSSITREHEVAFYTPNAEPYEVEILE